MRRILLTFLFALSLMAVLPQRMSAAANIEIIDNDFQQITVTVTSAGVLHVTGANGYVLQVYNVLRKGCYYQGGRQRQAYRLAAEVGLLHCQGRQRGTQDFYQPIGLSSWHCCGLLPFLPLLDARNMSLIPTGG